MFGGRVPDFLRKEGYVVKRWLVTLIAVAILAASAVASAAPPWKGGGSGGGGGMTTQGAIWPDGIW